MKATLQYTVIIMVIDWLRTNKTILENFTTNGHFYKFWTILLQVLDAFTSFRLFNYKFWPILQVLDYFTTSFELFYKF